jgi:menaquinone-dependent protoporphyrinogen IX oxidase
MNSKTLVVYSSKYGSTKKYAEWIAEKCNAELFSLPDFDIEKLNDYETVIFGASVYIGKIRDIKFIKKNWDILKLKQTAVFTVTAAPQDDPMLDKIFRWNLPEHIREKVSYFKLRGAFDYKKLTLKDRILMQGPITMLRFKWLTGRDKKAKEHLQELFNANDWTDENTVLPIVEFAKKLRNS